MSVNVSDRGSGCLAIICWMNEKDRNLLTSVLLSAHESVGEEYRNTFQEHWAVLHNGEPWQVLRYEWIMSKDQRATGYAILCSDFLQTREFHCLHGQHGSYFCHTFQMETTTTARVSLQAGKCRVSQKRGQASLGPLEDSSQWWQGKKCGRNRGRKRRRKWGKQCNPGKKEVKEWPNRLWVLTGN